MDYPKRYIMKILFFDSPAFAKQDMIDAFEDMNIACDLFFHEEYNDRQSTAFSAAFDVALQEASYDFVFSFNYYPILSSCCQRHGIRYVSYVYDSPLVALYSCTLINPCNYVFLFDKATYLTFKNAGISTVYSSFGCKCITAVANDLPGICTFCGIGGGIICRLPLQRRSQSVRSFKRHLRLYARLSGIHHECPAPGIRRFLPGRSADAGYIG